MITLINNHIIPAAYAVLPSGMASDRATAMLLAIALQESNCEHRKQIGGPAKGFWQFELGGGVHGVKNHVSSRNALKAALTTLRYNPNLTTAELHAIIQHNDVLACVFARLLLWTLPQTLPQPWDVQGAWRQYISAWRPGKPHPSVWAANHKRAWSVVNDTKQEAIYQLVEAERVATERRLANLVMSDSLDT